MLDSGGVRVCYQAVSDNLRSGVAVKTLSLSSCSGCARDVCSVTMDGMREGGPKTVMEAFYRRMVVSKELKKEQVSDSFPIQQI
jgi:hypothetical protein